VKAQKSRRVRALKEKKLPRNPKEEGPDQGHEMREGDEGTDPGITDTEGEGTLQVLHPAAQSQTPNTDSTSRGRRVRWRD